MAYPGTIDSFPLNTDGVDDALAADMNAVQNSIVNTQTELGTDPAGSYADVKDRLEAIDTDDWTAWTPVITQGVAVTATVIQSTYRKLGHLAEAHFRLNITGAGTGGAIISISGIPAAIQTVGKPMGVGMVVDSGGGIYVGIWYATAADDWRMYVHQVGSTSYVGTVPSFALASGDILFANLHWYM